VGSYKTSIHNPLRDVPSRRRVALDEVAAWLHLFAYVHGEHTIGFDGVMSQSFLL
jgi:hypothetical protein